MVWKQKQKFSDISEVNDFVSVPIPESTVPVLAQKSSTETFDYSGGVVAVSRVAENEEGEIVEKSEGCATALVPIGNEKNLVDAGCWH